MTGRSGKLVAKSVFSATLVASAIFACFGPTSMTLDLYTDQACRPGGALAPRTAVFVGDVLDATSEPQADTFDCDPGAPDNHIGKLTLSATGDRSARVTAHVVLNTSGGGTAVCRAPVQKPDGTLKIADTCIVARRTFRFLEHSARTLRVGLYTSCLGVYCEKGKTCVDGKCLTDDVEDSAFCEGAGCGDAGPDADVDASDAAQDIDSASDAAPPPSPCFVPPGGVLVSAIEPAKLMAANSASVFWVANDVAAGKDTLYSIPKTSTSPADIAVLYQSTKTGASINALAVDDERAWIGEKDLLANVRLSNKVLTPITGFTGDVLAITLVAGGGIPTQAYFSVAVPAAQLELAKTGASGPIDKLLDAAGKARGGESIAAAGNSIFILDRAASKVFVYPLPWDPLSAPKPTDSTDEMGYLAAAVTPSGPAAFVTTKADTVGYVAVGAANVATLADGVAGPTKIVADAANTYLIAAKSGGTDIFYIFRTGVGPPGALATGASLLGPAYTGISSLAMDKNCVFYSSTLAPPASLAPYQIRVMAR